MQAFQIPLRRRDGSLAATVWIDAADAAAVSRYTWSLSGSGRYAYRQAPRSEGKRRAIYLHRFLMGLEPGDGREVDHIDGNTLNNRRSNLRVTNRHEQMQNVPSQSTAVSRHRGVSKQGNRWRARVQVAGRVVHYSTHPTEQEAAGAARIAREQHMTHNVEARHG